MKKVLMVIFISALFSCKTKKTSCDAYSTIQFIKQDTLCIESQHVHVGGEQICSYFDDIATIIIDTIEIKIFN